MTIVFMGEAFKYLLHAGEEFADIDAPREARKVRLDGMSRFYLFEPNGETLKVRTLTDIGGAFIQDGPWETNLGMIRLADIENEDLQNAMLVYVAVRNLERWMVKNDFWANVEIPEWMIAPEGEENLLVVEYDEEEKELFANVW